MPKRQSIDQDEVHAAFRVVAEATGAAPKTKPPKKRKDPHAVALGRKGGLAAGKTRKDKIPEARRIEIAREAARIRWEKERQKS